MIDRKQAEENGIVAIDGGGRLSANREALRDKLKALLPALVNSDGHVDAKALQDVVDVANSRGNNQGYELTFAGKGLARAMADSPTEYELKTEIGQSKDFHNTGNVVIRGDNIDALKILYQNYFGKIKMIYIDPPYNTKGENFIYKDDFRNSDAELVEKHGLDEEATDFLHNIYGTRSHSGWLSFMYPRLKLARDLLSDDGVIFISIDDNEMANLKIICDEIFGEDNECYIWRKSDDGRYGKMKNTNTVRNDHEYVLAIFKKKNEAAFSKIGVYPQFASRPREDEKGKWWQGYIARGERGSNPNHVRYYTVRSPDGIEFTAQFEVDKEEFEHLDNNGYIHWSSTGVPYRKIYAHEKRKIVASSVFLDVGTSYSGKCDLEESIDSVHVFDNPKPINLIKRLMELSTSINGNDFVLDFFAGSGTTGDAVMRQNAEDGGNRKFILVQWDEAIDKKKKESQAAYDFCVKNGFNPVISSITIERLNRAGEKIKAETKKQNITLLTEAKKPLPDIGYKVYSLAPNPTIAEREGKGNLQLGAQNKRKTPLDTLTNMLCATGKTLSAPTECVKKNTIYKTKDSLYVLGNVSAEDLQPYGDYDIYLDGWADIDLIALLNIGFHDKSKKEKLKVVY